MRIAGALIVAGLLAAGGCADAPKTSAERENLTSDAQASLRSLERDHPGLAATVDAAAGYAIFPSVAKGGLVVEAACGQGTVYEPRPVRRLRPRGPGQHRRRRRRRGLRASCWCSRPRPPPWPTSRPTTCTRFDATASAVALKAGASADAKFMNDVAAFKKSNSGLMLDASIGGQQFTFTRDAAAGPATEPANPLDR